MAVGDAVRVYRFLRERSDLRRASGEKELTMPFEDIVRDSGANFEDVAQAITTKRKLTEETGLRLKSLTFYL